MPNQNGSVYGLTILSPILGDEKATPSHDLQIRDYLATMPTGEDSPFALAPGTHLARLVVMDDVVFVGHPAHGDHLKSRYLIFETNFDGDLDTYLRRMATETKEFVEAVWKHCVGYPGTNDVDAFIAYMKKCQLNTTFYFADVNDQTVESTLTALKTQAALAHFMEKHEGVPAAELQRAFREFYQRLSKSPALPRGGNQSRDIRQEKIPHD